MMDIFNLKSTVSVTCFQRRLLYIKRHSFTNMGESLHDLVVLITGKLCSYESGWSGVFIVWDLTLVYTDMSPIILLLPIQWKYVVGSSHTPLVFCLLGGGGGGGRWGCDSLCRSSWDDSKFWWIFQKCITSEYVFRHRDANIMELCAVTIIAT